MHVYVGMCAHAYVYIHIAVCVQSHCLVWSVWYEVSGHLLDRDNHCACSPLTYPGVDRDTRALHTTVHSLRTLHSTRALHTAALALRSQHL